jgi:glutamine cyclotransferase
MNRILLALCLWLTLVPLAYSADTYRIVHTYPHDPHAFTQGLVFVDGSLYESTGLNGQSSLRMVDIETGRILQSQPVDSKYFAEGLTAWGSTLVQLTWESHVAMVYDRFSFRAMRTFSYSGEGWGLTQDGVSPSSVTGQNSALFRSGHLPRRRRMSVKDTQARQRDQRTRILHGEIFRISGTRTASRDRPGTGKVLGGLIQGLSPTVARRAVLNGIAYDSVHDRLFVTGKLWLALRDPSCRAAQACSRALENNGSG